MLSLDELGMLKFSSTSKMWESFAKAHRGQEKAIKDGYWLLGDAARIVVGCSATFDKPKDVTVSHFAADKRSLIRLGV